MPAQAGIYGRVNQRWQPAVYMLTNRLYGVLYTGVTTDLRARVEAHRAGRGGDFTRRYRCHRLVYFEFHQGIADAIAREKALKAWKREWKLRLIAEQNPGWDDLFGELHLI